MCSTSFSFSQTFSMMSVSGRRTKGIVTVHGFVYIFASSNVNSMSRCPKSRRRQRSVDLHRLAAWMATVVEPAFVVEAGDVDDEGVAVPFAERVAEPRGARSVGKSRPSVKICRHCVKFSKRITMRFGVCTTFHG